MQNQDYINKYKNDNLILGNNYLDSNGVAIDKIVNPLKIDNRQLCSPTDCQGDTPHCAGYSVAQLLESLYWKKTGIPIQLDASQIYAKAKEIDKKVKMDGTDLESVFKATFKLLNIRNKKLYVFYNTLDQNTIETFKFIIHKYDFLVCGFMITESWYDCINSNYLIKVDKSNQIGGHAVLACGYDKEGVFIQNHWGIEWGFKGFAKLTWEAFLNQFVYGAYVDFSL